MISSCLSFLSQHGISFLVATTVLVVVGAATLFVDILHEEGLALHPRLRIVVPLLLPRPEAHGKELKAVQKLLPETHVGVAVDEEVDGAVECHEHERKVGGQSDPKWQVEASIADVLAKAVHLHDLIRVEDDARDVADQEEGHDEEEHQSLRVLLLLLLLLLVAAAAKSIVSS